MNMRILVLLLALAALSFNLPAQSTPAVTEMYSFIVQHEADEGSLERFYIIPGSPERRKRLTEFYEAQLKKLDALPFESFSTGGKADFLLMRRDIQNELVLLAQEEKETSQVARLTAPADGLYPLEKQRRRGLHLKSDEVAGQLNAMVKSVQAAVKRLPQEPNLAPNLAARASQVVAGQEAALKSVYEFYNGYDPQFSWWTTRPYQQLDTALTKYSAALKKKVDVTLQPKDDGSGIIGNPIGREELIHLLQLEMIPYTPEELVDIANKEFAWCDAEMLKASREMGFGDNWKQALEKVKQSYVPEGQQPEAMLDLYNQSVEFLKKNDLITIPPIAEETWRMRMIPPRQQLISPFFLGGETLQISYPTDAMNHDDKLMSMRGNNPHFSRATVHHELIAGHHLQGFMNNRNKPYRHYRNPFWSEGWALYWELILWDMNFPRGPEDKIGMLFWLMHRCARIIFSLNYHLGKWTPQQCIDFLVDRVGHERENATAEVRRSFAGMYGPLYQAAYMLGGLQLRMLRKELVGPGKMTDRAFHDAVLRENAIPIELIRASLSPSIPLERDFKTTWKFYGPL